MNNSINRLSIALLILALGTLVLSAPTLKNDVDEKSKRSFDSFSGPFSGFDKRSFDSFSGPTFSGFDRKRNVPVDMKMKRSFDSFGGVGFNGLDKRSFDSLNGRGFTGFDKRSFDSLNGRGFTGFD